MMFANIDLFSFKLKANFGSMNGWMACDFTSFSTIFQSYQDDVRVIMKGCVQENLVYTPVICNHGPQPRWTAEDSRKYMGFLPMRCLRGAGWVSAMVLFSRQNAGEEARSSTDL